MARTITADTENEINDTETENEGTDVTMTDETTATSTDGETKRTRVDLEKVAAENPNEKVVLTVQIPAGLKLMIRKTADEGDVSETEYVRNLLAAKFEYSIPDEFNERRGRKGRYANLTDEQKKEAIAKESEAKREMVSNVLAAVQNNENAKEILIGLGIDVSKLPKPRKAKAS